jgi:hypothetical protein
MGEAGRLKTLAGCAEEAQESRPMESEHTVVEINLILLLYENLVIN